MSHWKLRRRDLFHGAAASAAVVTASSYSRILGANDRIRVGQIGYGVRGPYVMAAFQKSGMAEIAAVCDLYGVRADKAKQAAPEAKVFTDHRRLLEMKELDAVNISTPDHWHCPIAIAAMRAGKDVYVEKPLTLRIEEGFDVIKTVRQTGRICQIGTQRRSGAAYIDAKREYVDTGLFGKPLTCRVWWYNNPVHILKAPPELKTQPHNLDWELYLGQVRWRDWDPQQYWCFRAYLDFGGGQITDLFAHWTDVFDMFFGADIPCVATAVGGIYYYQDGRTAPDTIHAALEYPQGFTATFDGALAAGGRISGGEFIGTKGRLYFDARRLMYYPPEKGAPPVVREYPEEPTAAHVANFLECMRSRKQPRADVLAGHRAAQAAHLCNIAYVRQERIRFDPGREAIVA